MASLDELLTALFGSLGPVGSLLILLIVFALDAALFPALPEVWIVLTYTYRPEPLGPIAWAGLLLAMAVAGDVVGTSLLYAAVRRWVVQRRRMPHWLERAMKKWTSFLLVQDERVILMNRAVPVIPMVGAFIATLGWRYRRSMAYVSLGGLAKYAVLLYVVFGTGSPDRGSRSRRDPLESLRASRTPICGRRNNTRRCAGGPRSPSPAGRRSRSRTGTARSTFPSQERNRWRRPQCGGLRGRGTRFRRGSTAGGSRRRRRAARPRRPRARLDSAPRRGLASPLRGRPPPQRRRPPASRPSCPSPRRSPRPAGRSGVGAIRRASGGISLRSK